MNGRTISVRLGTWLVFGCSGACSGDRIGLTLENVGRAALDSVVVVTTGRRYPIGDLPAGEKRRVMIGAVGESHIEIEHGKHGRRSLRVGTYFEDGYGGRISVRVTPDSVVSVADSIKIW